MVYLGVITWETLIDMSDTGHTSVGVDFTVHLTTHKNNFNFYNMEC